MLDAISNAPISAVGMLNEQVFGPSESDLKKGEVEKKDESKKISDLTPGQVKLIEAIEEKIMKIGFKTKLRGIYIAEKDVFRPERGAQALVGAVNQFNIPSHNSLVPKYGVNASYIGAEKKKIAKKNLLMEKYKKRKASIGKKVVDPYILNIEELATIWHFPMSHVKTPLLQKAQDKKSEPPSGLPVEAMGGLQGMSASQPPSGSDQPAVNQPVRSYDLDTGEGYDEGQRFG